MDDQTKTTGHVVGGVRMERPFQIRRLGHFGLDMENIEAARDFYMQNFGFRIADPLDLGHRLPPGEAFLA
jgi:catechol-2,3-dioxygenase